MSRRGRHSSPTIMAGNPAFKFFSPYFQHSSVFCMPLPVPGRPSPGTSGWLRRAPSSRLPGSHGKMPPRTGGCRTRHLLCPSTCGRGTRKRSINSCTSSTTAFSWAGEVGGFPYSRSGQHRSPSGSSRLLYSGRLPTPNSCPASPFRPVRSHNGSRYPATPVKGGSGAPERCPFPRPRCDE